MTKKVLIILSIILVAFVVIFFNLPFEITRKSDIEFGYELVDRIDEYQKKNDALPESNSWEILGKIGFKIETMGTKPSYEKIDNNSYQLIYIEEFDGPYLLLGLPI